MKVAILKTGQVVDASKVPAVTLTTCPLCSKKHVYFWRIQGGQIEDDRPDYPGYASRRWCECKIK